MRYITLIATVLASATLQAQCEPDFDFGEAEWGASPDASVGEQFDTAYVDVPYVDDSTFWSQQMPRPSTPCFNFRWTLSF